MTPSGRRLFIGIGNPLRGDDAAGLLAARALRALEPRGIEVLELEGEPLGLIEAWEGAASVAVADAVASDGRPGEVRRVNAAAGPLPAAMAGASTHAMGLAEAIELARALERLPPLLVVYGIGAAGFETGFEPGPAVRAAALRVAGAAASELGATLGARVKTS
jgi:hydrogenase maturation protease